MNLDIERLGQGEKIAAGSALALLICMFLSWFNLGYTTQSAWDSLHFISPILSIAVVTTVGIALAETTGFSLGDIPGGMTIFVLGCLSAVLILYRLIDPVSTVAVEGGSTSASVEAGAFLGFIAALGIAVGGYIATDGKAIHRLKAALPSNPGVADNPGASSGQPYVPPTQSPPAAPTAAPSAAAPSTAAPGPVAPEPIPEAPSTAGSVPTAEPPPAPAAPDPVPPAPEPEVSEPKTAVSPTEPVAAASSPRSVFCEGCGAPLRPEDRFCRKCGHQQVEAVSPGT